MPDPAPVGGEVPAAPARGRGGRRFDVFLSHNSRDKPLVERIAERLKRARLEPWLDAWCLVPGSRLAAGARGGPGGVALVRGLRWPGRPGRVGEPGGRGRARPGGERSGVPALPGAAAGAAGAVRCGRPAAVPADAHLGRLPPRARRRARLPGPVSAIKGVPLGPAVPIEPSADVCPYRGLEAFEEEHAEFFFGRDADVQRLLEKLKATRFLAVLGASGSGKSSLVRAGLVPALKHGALPGAERWEVAVMRPGAHPLEALAAQLLRLRADRRDAAHARRARRPTRARSTCRVARARRAATRDAAAAGRGPVRGGVHALPRRARAPRLLRQPALRRDDPGRPQRRLAGDACRFLPALRRLPGARAAARRPAVPRQPDATRRAPTGDRGACAPGRPRRSSPGSSRRSSTTSPTSRARCRCWSTPCSRSGGGERAGC